MRLLSVDASGYGRDGAALASLIESHRPDVACIHHAPSRLRWRSTCAAIARQAGLVVVGGGRTGGGNLVLSSLGVDVEQTGDVLFGASPLAPGATLAALRLRGRPFLVAAARLGGGADARRAQAEQLQSHLSGFGPDRPPIVLSIDGADGLGDAGVLTGRLAVAGGVYVDPRIEVGRVEPGLAPQPTIVEVTLPEADR